MRKIEEEMLAAIAAKKNWSKGNMGVFFENNGNPFGSRSKIYLHGNHIASIWHGDGALPIVESEKVEVNNWTLCDYPTPTTKSRLRALGVNLTQKKGKIYINDRYICEVK